MNTPTDKELDELLRKAVSSAYQMGFLHCQGVSVGGEDWNAKDAEQVYADKAKTALLAWSKQRERAAFQEGYTAGIDKGEKDTRFKVATGQLKVELKGEE